MGKNVPLKRLSICKEKKKVKLTKLCLQGTVLKQNHTERLGLKWWEKIWLVNY